VKVCTKSLPVKNGERKTETGGRKQENGRQENENREINLGSDYADSWAKYFVGEECSAFMRCSSVQCIRELHSNCDYNFVTAEIFS